MSKVDKKVRSRIWSLETQIGKGILDGTHDPERFANVLQDFLENKGEEKSEFAALNQAIDILGQGKVITVEQSAKAWSLEEPKDATIRYSDATLRQCAKENSHGKRDTHHNTLV